MSCKKKWTRYFLSENFPQTFVHKEYVLHKENLLLEREKALLPATQVHVPIILKRRGLQRMNELIEEEKREIQHLPYLEKEERETELEAVYRLIRKKYHILNHTKPEEKKDKQRFVMKCPIGDCRGFLSSRYKCGVCDGKICSECHIELQEEKHDCDPDLVKTVEELKKSTRGCPNCHVPIYKSSGCDQMWCVNCHTAFNWKTGEIEKGIIHNPEYFEFLRQNKIAVRNPHEQVCGGLPYFDSLRLYSRTRSEAVFLSDYYQSLTHLRQDTLRRLPTNLDNQNNQDLRISYLMKEISESEFKSTLQKREKDREKGIEYRQFLTTYITVGEDLFRQLVDGQVTIKAMAKNVLELLTIINREIENLNKAFKSKLSTLCLSPRAHESATSLSG
jgi:hypothetical protein